MPAFGPPLRSLGLAMFCFSVPLALEAQEGAAPSQIVTTATGEATLVPDRGYVTFAVETRAKTAQEAMDSLCAEQEKVLERLERAGVQGDIGPQMGEEHDLEYWNKDAVSKGNLAPQLKIENEKEKPLTVNYDELVKSWQK